jgi:hypothetical protein
MATPITNYIAGTIGAILAVGAPLPNIDIERQAVVEVFLPEQQARRRAGVCAFYLGFFKESKSG